MVDDGPKLLMFVAHEMFVDDVAEHIEKGVVVVVGVEDDDGLEEESELFPSDEFKKFFEGAASAGESDGRVDVGRHDFLSFMH